MVRNWLAGLFAAAFAAGGVACSATENQAEANVDTAMNDRAAWSRNAGSSPSKKCPPPIDGDGHH